MRGDVWEGIGLEGVIRRARPLRGKALLLRGEGVCRDTLIEALIEFFAEADMGFDLITHRGIEGHDVGVAAHYL